MQISRDKLEQCGEERIHILQNAANCLTINHCLGPDSSRELDQLIEQAYSTMLATRGADPIQWRRLYSDASILRSLADLTSSQTPDEQTATSCIARLDRALVIAGAPGQGVWILIQDLILTIQATCLPREPFECSPKPAFIPTKPQSNRSTSALATSSNTILKLANPPSLSVYRRELLARPFILMGFALNWPAMNEHPWHSIRYLRSVAGRGRVVPVEVGSDYRSNDWTQRMMPWDDFLDALEKDSSHAQPILYMAQHNLLSQFPALREDILVPDYVFTAPQAPVTYPSYRPPNNEEELVLSAWLGPVGTVSPAHTDPFFNSYAQVVGCKTVWLAPPTSTVTKAMYPYPPPSPTSDSERARNPAANQLAPSMTNTAQVDVFSDQDRDRFPLFWRYAVPEALSATLEPGDVLFFPPGWWHAMRSEEMSFSVSMWF
ncbi:Clavaminate synthase-like protein [Lactarius psammicola]|nr:Clavaminate synthase-like protein [Lactarius psammicola]